MIHSRPRVLLNQSPAMPAACAGCLHSRTPQAPLCIAAGISPQLSDPHSALRSERNVQFTCDPSAVQFQTIHVCSLWPSLAVAARPLAEVHTDVMREPAWLKCWFPHCISPTGNCPLQTAVGVNTLLLTFWYMGELCAGWVILTWPSCKWRNMRVIYNIYVIYIFD